MKIGYKFLFIVFCSVITAVASFACDFNGAGENIYKHFRGTIGTRTIVLDLRYGFCGASNFGGSYFYEPGSNIIGRIVIREPESRDHNATFNAIEYKLEDDWNFLLMRLPKTRPNWVFKMTSDKLTGKWISSDGKTVLDINLTEESANTTPLEMMYYTCKTESGTERPDIRYDFIGIKPDKISGDINAMFINASLLMLANKDNVIAESWSDFPKNQGKKVLADYERGLAILIADTSQHEPKKNYSNYTIVFPLYNENGFLTMEYDCFIDIPANIIKWGSRYCNIDIKVRRIWEKNDILKADDITITKLLQDEFATKIDPKSEKDKHTKDKIAATENIAVLNDGLLFCPLLDNKPYSDEIRIFIPYSRLNSMLTKDFMKRINL